MKLSATEVSLYLQPGLLEFYGNGRDDQIETPLTSSNMVRVPSALLFSLGLFPGLVSLGLVGTGPTRLVTGLLLTEILQMALAAERYAGWIPGRSGPRLPMVLKLEQAWIVVQDSSDRW